MRLEHHRHARAGLPRPAAAAALLGRLALALGCGRVVLGRALERQRRLGEVRDRARARLRVRVRLRVGLRFRVRVRYRVAAWR